MTRCLAVAALIAIQFTVVPFLAIVASHAVRHEQQTEHAALANVTTIYKTNSM